MYHMNTNLVSEKGYSTNMALIVLMDKILNAIDNGELVLGVFWTLASQAFSTINHDILFSKLYKYGGLINYFRLV